MKVLPWILVGLLIGLLVWMLLRPHDQSIVYRKSDTITVYDTVRDTVPTPVKQYIIRLDTVYLPILIDSTDNKIEGDSIPVVIPITRKEYKTDKYKAVISGYKPNLDFIETYNKMQTITITPKKKRWGIGLQVGCGYPSGWYVGCGINYNIYQW